MHINLANRTGAFGLLVFDALEAALGDLSPSAAAFLLTAFYRPGSTTSVIAAVAGVSQPTGVRVLGGLRARGYIHARSQAGRTAPIVLTAEGEERARQLQSSRLAAMERLVAALSDADARQFGSLIDRIMAQATTSRAFARTTCRLCDHPRCNEPDCPLGTSASALERIAAKEER